MSMSTFQKVTLATCLVLCVGLLLPKMLLSGGRKDAAHDSGRFPSMMQRQAAPEGRGQRAAGSRAHGTEAVSRAKGAGTGVGTGGKSNLAGQIIPVYGFGILLYILYILFKITSKGNNKPSESRFPSVRSESTKRKISDFELAQLQDKLRETELVMENIVNHSPDRVEGVTADQEESLLQQLTEITRVMQEGQLVDRMAPEEKTREDWEDYPEEPPEPPWERSRCCCQHGEQHHHHGPESTRADGDDPEGEGEGEGGGGGGGGGGAGAGAPDPSEEMESEEAAVETGVPEDGLAGVLEELELTLKMTSAKAEDLSGAAEVGASCGAVRRRNKRRRAKKAAH
ncbi:protein RIC-3b [Pseudoliparis swirei]|uniref:protein RIC-3b n=1 Tax=Pseudoliparis swirei TaxID=2059687 RepID=UPI0024BDBA7F|nr:protein RIC-3b [Pseudoliparis swirei]